jgi:hypothetical protein
MKKELMMQMIMQLMMQLMMQLVMMPMVDHVPSRRLMVEYN